LSAGVFACESGGETPLELAAGTLRYEVVLGAPTPAHSTSSGKSILFRTKNRFLRENSARYFSSDVVSGSEASSTWQNEFRRASDS